MVKWRGRRGEKGKGKEKEQGEGRTERRRKSREMEGGNMGRGKERRASLIRS